ncbi:MAG: hypothetical protein WAS07_03620 [Micropruina sp.]|nr:hypothetical protein [Micropruina sp.]
MDLSIVFLIIAVVTTVVLVLIVAVIWSRAQPKAIVAWLGFAMLPMGLYLAGLAPRLFDAYTTLSQWFYGLTYSTSDWVGLGLLGGGLAFLLISRLMPHRPRRPKPAAPSVSASRPAPPASSYSPDPSTAEATKILHHRDGA